MGEGNGSPLQCSCLENPRDGGALWAAIYGVTQSRTRLKRLSSSNISVTLLHDLAEQKSPPPVSPLPPPPSPVAQQAMEIHKVRVIVSHVLLLLLLLSRFSHVRLCVTPEMAAHQAPPSLGFSRQEHWSGVPLPSPIAVVNGY